eukprot:664002-Karenia_brevis.AAC.1
MVMMMMMTTMMMMVMMMVAVVVVMMAMMMMVMMLLISCMGDGGAFLCPLRPTHLVLYIGVAVCAGWGDGDGTVL